MSDPRRARLRARARGARGGLVASRPAYFVPVELGLEDEPLLLLPLGDELLLPDVLVSLELDEEPDDPLGGVVLVDGGVDGVVVVGGEADGGDPPGRSPTRSVRDSLQAVSSAALSATAQRPVSTLFIFGASSCWGCADYP